MSEIEYRPVQVITPIGSNGMSPPKVEFLNNYYQEFGDFFTCCCQVGNDADYRIENGCMSMISLVDNIAQQNELREFYHQRSEELLQSYCTNMGVNPRDLSENEIIYLQRSVACECVGKVSLWIGRHFAIRRRNIIGVCRGPPGWDGDDGKYQIRADQELHREFNLPKYYAQIITGKISLDVSQLTAGFRGSGKSIKDLRLAETTAGWVSYMMDGDPTIKGSRNYFNEDLIACIDAEEAEDLMQQKGKYIIKDYDDITAKGWNSRNSITKANKQKNANFMINRIDRQAQLFSFPDLFTLDKVPRNMASHLCEMQKNTTPMRKHVQHSMSKLFEIDKNFRADVPYYYFLIWENAIVSYVVYPKCSKYMSDIYTIKREEATEKAKRQGTDAEKSNDVADVPIMHSGVVDDVQHVVHIKRTGPQKNAERKYQDYLSARAAGATHREAMQQNGISMTNWNYWTAKNWIPKEVI